MGRTAGYEVLWRRLFELKFFEYADNISAAWICTRIKRVGTSRKSLLQEELGSSMAARRRSSMPCRGDRRGRRHYPARHARRARSSPKTAAVKGVRTDAGTSEYDYVISTAPTPFVPAMVPALPEASKAAYDAIRNIGVVCVVLKLKKPVTPHFWLNINDPAIDIPGIVEFSNLRRLPDTVVYVPYYMPQTHPKFEKPADFFVGEAMDYIRASTRRFSPTT